MERFWAKVDKSGDCWIWIAGKNWGGYGRFWFDNGMKTASRISYILTFGPIPKNICVLHKCDNRSCVKPEHLFLGTKKENQLDMAYKGRSTYGEKHPRSKLSSKQIEEIRSIKPCKGMRGTDLAKIYNVTPQNIYAIWKRKSWQHLT